MLSLPPELRSWKESNWLVYGDASILIARFGEGAYFEAHTKVLSRGRCGKHQMRKSTGKRGA